jgi:pentose-5-phosphate-3-epimerase
MCLCPEGVPGVCSLLLQVLVMSVPCGFGGQPFQEAALSKLAALRAAYPALDLQVRGGWREVGWGGGGVSFRDGL